MKAAEYYAQEKMARAETYRKRALYWYRMDHQVQGDTCFVQCNRLMVEAAELLGAST